MKCPNCNQIIVDNKVYCTNCGSKIKKSALRGIDPIKLFMIVVVFMLLLGLGTIYIVANMGTKNELNNILKTKTTIDSFYGSYLISSVISTEDTPKDLLDNINSVINNEIELSKNKFKAAFPYGYFSKIINPSIKKIDTPQKYIDELQTASSNVMVINVKGSNTIRTEQSSFDLISVGSKVYLYSDNTYFELKKSNLGFKSSDTFYSINLPTKNYPENINKKLDEIRSEAKTSIESGKVMVYDIFYEEYVDNDAVHLVITKHYNDSLYSEPFSNTKIISFNKESGFEYNLKSYIEHIGKKYEDIIKEYEIKKIIPIDEGIKMFETSPNLSFYVKDNILNIAYGEDYYGLLYAKINLKGE